MAKLPGLSPVGEDQSNMREKRGRTPVRRDTAPQVSLTPAAQAVDTYIRPAQPPNDTRLGQLADALTNLNPALQGYIKQSDARLEQQQMEQVEYLTEQFRRDHEGGAVTAAQVKETFPELVPTVAARIAQSIASRDAKEFAQDRAQAILEDDSIRLNSEARREAMEAFRQEAMEQIGDNPFYGSAFLGQFDKTFNEFETAWMRETAAYHEQVQMEEFSTLAAETIASGGDLMELDSQWRSGSSLNNRQRNQAIVQAAINLATGSMDGRVLNNVPDRFLNAESKAQFIQTQQAIERAKHSMWSQNRERTEHARNMAIRDAQSSVLQRMANGESVNPLEFVHLPEVAGFVESWNSRPLLDPVASQSAAQRLGHGFLVVGLSGNSEAAFSNDPEASAFFRDRPVTRDNMLEHIATRSDLNPAERASLMQQVDVFADGQNLLQHPSVQNQQRVLNRHLQVLEQSLAQTLGGLSGASLTADAEAMFQDSIAEKYMQHLAENGTAPPSYLMNQFAREAVAEARGFAQETASLVSNAGIPQQQPTATPAATPTTSHASSPRARAGGETSTPETNEPAPVRTRRWNPATGTFEEQ